MKYGYVCIGPKEQCSDIQIQALKDYVVDEIFEDTQEVQPKRPQLAKLLSKLRAGDYLVVWNLDSLGKTVKQLLALLDDLQLKGIILICIRDNLDLATINTLIQLEKTIISERTKAGMNAAIKQGRQPGRPKKSKEAVNRALEMYYSNNYTLSEIEDTTGITRTTLYKYLKTREGKKSERKG